jgi:hypothetical protein
VIILMIVALIILFDIAAYVGGADSREGPFSREWEERQNWKGFGGSGY